MSLPKPTINKTPGPTKRRRPPFHTIAPAIAAEMDGPLRTVYTGAGDASKVPPGWTARSAYVGSASYDQMLEAVWSLCAILETSDPCQLAQLKGLADLATPDVFKALGEAMADGRPITNYEQRALRKVCQIAREVLGLSPAALAALDEIRADLKSASRQMSERTKRALMPYVRKPWRVRELYALPRQLIEQAKGRCPRYALCDWQLALSLALTLDALLTPADLGALHRENLIVPKDIALPVDVLIAEPVKASFALNATLSAETSLIVREYLDFLHDVIGLIEVDYLFVNLDKTHRTDSTSVRLAARIKAAIGFPLSLEQISALVVGLYLSKNPLDLETAKRALGLRDLSGFTERFSAIMTLAAGEIATRHAEEGLDPEVLFGRDASAGMA